MVLKTVLPHTKPPPGFAFLPNPNQKKADPRMEEDPITGPTSFLKRYWYILLPLLIANVFATDPPPQSSSKQGRTAAEDGTGNAITGSSGGETGGAGGGGPAAVAAAAAAGGGAAGSPGKRTRRGKQHK